MRGRSGAPALRRSWPRGRFIAEAADWSSNAEKGEGDRSAKDGEDTIRGNLDGFG